jgi:heme oxygenase (biliverdin-producing, ferredoxin)
MSSNLAIKLRDGAKKIHTIGEHVDFAKCILRCVVELASYRKLVANLYFVYSAMEEEMERYQQHPILSKIYFRELNRQQSLEQDLKYYYGSQWREQINLSSAGETYVRRIREVANFQPELLISHLYTRYLGDLSGGQIIKGIVQRAMNLSNGQGVAFYEFPDISNKKQFKAVYRQKLNELPIDEATSDRIIEEAKAAFGMNMKVFKELERNLSSEEKLHDILKRLKPTTTKRL